MTSHHFVLRQQSILSFLFLAALLSGFCFWLPSQEWWLLGGWLWIAKYGVTEWMINYQSGFIRRGLPGQIIYDLSVTTEWNVAWIVFAICVLTYCIYVWILIRSSYGRFPRWALWSSPLLGYPIYTGDLIRKDCLLLVSLCLLLKVIAVPGFSVLRRVFIILTCCVSILSHEIFIFMALPLCITIDLAYAIKQKNTNHMLLFCIGQLFLTWFLPVVSALFAISSKGNTTQAFNILESWSKLIPVNERSNLFRYGLIGSLSWVDKSIQYAYNSTNKLLNATHSGLPFYFIVIMFICIAVLAIASSFSNKLDRVSYVSCFLIQFLFMLPIYLFALDQGRWIFLTINSSFIFVLLSPVNIFDLQSRLLKKYINKLTFRFAEVYSLLVLCMWGFPVHIWSLKRVLECSPIYNLFQLPLNIYFNLRVNNLIPPLL